MASSSFALHKAKLDEACTFLRSFTLARPGYTLRDASVGIERVNAVCERLKKLFARGPNAKEAVLIVASARARVAAAEARIALLTKKR